MLWIMSLACRTPANTPAADRKGVDEIWATWLARKAGKKMKKKLKRGAADSDDEEHKEDEEAEQEHAGKQAEDANGEPGAGTARANGDSRNKNNAVHPFTAPKPDPLVVD